MGEGTPATQRKTGNPILRLLGLGSGPSAAAEPLPHLPLNPHQAARQMLIDRIGDFLIASDCDITAPNLLCLHAAFSGADLNMARKIAER